MTRLGKWGLLALVLVLGQAAYADTPSRAPATPLPVQIGTSYNMAQTALALPGERLAVGRWDGSLQLWQLPDKGMNSGPQLRQAQVVPSGAGVQMVAALDGGRLVSGHDEQSLAVWAIAAEGLVLRSIVEFDRTLGYATSATQLRLGAEPILVVGHESGWVTLWRLGRWSLSQAGLVDVRSPNPVPSPYPLRHLRAVLPWRDDVVITGSEDGDLAMLRIRSTGTGLQAKTLTRVRYSPTARRGINGLALSGDLLAVTSCAVGTIDPNLHLLRIEPGKLVPLDAASLKQDVSREQVFAFSVVFAAKPAGPLLWVSTQEGLVWQLRVDHDKLRPVGHVPVANGVGTALVYLQERELLVAVGHEATVLRVP